MLRENGPSSVTMLVCESVLREDNGIVSLVRIMDSVVLGPNTTDARFFVISYLHSREIDYKQHTAQVQMVANRGGRLVAVATAPVANFVYSYAVVPNAPGAHMLSTEFNMNVAILGELGTYWLQLSVDGELEEQTPITLLRRG